MSIFDDLAVYPALVARWQSYGRWTPAQRATVATLLRPTKPEPIRSVYAQVVPVIRREARAA